MDILIGLIGLPRTYIKAAEYIKKNIINSNPEYNFYVCLNTDLSGKQTIKNRDKLQINNLKDEIISKDLLEKNLKRLYKNFLHIFNFEIENRNISGATVFQNRIHNTLKKLNKKFDYYIFIRTDAIITKKLNLSEIIKKEKIYNGQLNIISGINNFDNIDNIEEIKKTTNRQCHWCDWDFCWLGNKDVFDKYYEYRFFEKKKISANEIIETINFINGWKEKWYKNVLKQNIDYNSYVYHFICIFYELKKKNYRISFDFDNEQIYSFLIR